MEELTSWIASHTPIYYGPALAAWLVVYKFTTDFSFSWVRNLIRGAVFAVLIGSKFVIRWKDKHVFNPTNLALVVMIGGRLGWISPGQWGQVAWFGLSLPISRSSRSSRRWAG